MKKEAKFAVQLAKKLTKRPLTVDVSGLHSALNLASKGLFPLSSVEIRQGQLMLQEVKEGKLVNQRWRPMFEGSSQLRYGPMATSHLFGHNSSLQKFIIPSSEDNIFFSIRYRMLEPLMVFHLTGDTHIVDLVRCGGEDLWTLFAQKFGKDRIEIKKEFFTGLYGKADAPPLSRYVPNINNLRAKVARKQNELFKMTGAGYVNPHQLMVRYVREAASDVLMRAAERVGKVANIALMTVDGLVLEVDRYEKVGRYLDMFADKEGPSLPVRSGYGLNLWRSEMNT